MKGANRSIYFPPGLHEKIKGIAEEKNLSVSKIIADKFSENNVTDPSAIFFEKLDRIEKQFQVFQVEIFREIFAISKKLLGDDSPMTEVLQGNGWKVAEMDTEPKFVGKITPEEEDMLKTSIRSARSQAELDKNREDLVRKKGETNAAWQIRRKVFLKT